MHVWVDPEDGCILHPKHVEQGKCNKVTLNNLHQAGLNKPIYNDAWKHTHTHTHTKKTRDSLCLLINYTVSCWDYIVSVVGEWVRKESWDKETGIWTPNPVWNGLGLNLGICSVRPTTYRLTYGIGQNLMPVYVTTWHYIPLPVISLRRNLFGLFSV